MAETPVTPIAVIGMACRLPGGIDSPDGFWQALLRRDDLVTKVPSDRWDADEYYDPEPGVPGRSVSKWGGFLDDVAGFDADFFGYGEREAPSIDPQHRLLLETSWEALEHAGLAPADIAESLTGVFLGMTHNDYQMVAAEADALDGAYGFAGTNFSLASGRVAYALGAHGPALTVDSACSSGLLAIHLACRSLHESESDLALAGGASLLLDPKKMVAGSAQGMLSPTGRCRAFDVGADGFVSGEGVAMVLLKRLADAERDGDRVLAVIRGTAANQDGHTINIATPSEAAQSAVYRAALSAGGVDPATVGMIEAHGTGTPVGDPIEFASLAAVYGTGGPCALGSVKTNIGHAQSASGAIGLIKAVLALQHGAVPANLHFTELPEPMARLKSSLIVPTELMAWPLEAIHPRRAAVSSYGLSGTNVHAVLEQAPDAAADSSAATRGGSEPMIFAVSSTSPDELRRTAGRLANWLAHEAGDQPLPDLAYTLARRRAHRPFRATVTAASAEELGAALREVAEGDAVYEAAVGTGDRGPVWLFSGQGSQWAGMGAQLLATEPAFAAAIAELEPLIQAESNFSVTEAISQSVPVEGIDRVQPTIFAMQVALAAAMKARGVQPGAVIGHSMGEAAAAVVAGALSLQDGVRVICRRSALMTRLSGSGAMASVELPAQHVLSELAARGITDVVISVIASPRSTVVGGTTERIRELIADWEQRDIMAREVAVDVASHSPQVDPILDELAEVLTDLTPLTPAVPYYSSTSYDPRDEPYLDADYWVDNLRHAVRFSAAVQAALEDGYRVFGELAPHPLLVHPAEQVARSLDINIAALASMRRETQLRKGLLGFVGDLHNAGAAVDFATLYPAGSLVDAPLPTWTRLPLTVSRDSREPHSGGGHLLSVHPLLGAHVVLPEDPERHIWQADVGVGAQPWLADHQVHNVPALPGAAYCEMALAAGRSLLGDACEVRDITFDQMLLLDEQTPVSAEATGNGDGAVQFVVETAKKGESIRRATAVIVETDPSDVVDRHDLTALKSAHPRRIEGDGLRKWFAHRGIQYGPAFSGLAAAYTAEDVVGSVLAEVALPSAIRSQQGAYQIHPALLDVCFQSVAAYAEGAEPGGLLLPLGVKSLRASGSTRAAHYCLLRVTAADAIGVEADLDLLDEDGTVLLAVRGLRLGSGMSESGQREHIFNERLLAVEWHEQEVPEMRESAAGRWLLITPDANDLLTVELADALSVDAGEVSTVVWSGIGIGSSDAEFLRDQLEADTYSDVVVLPAAATSVAGDRESASGGLEVVQRAVRIVQELGDLEDLVPRLHLITRDAQSVLPGDPINLDQVGLRGLVRVIGNEQPGLHATQIDIDARTAAKDIARQLLAGSPEDETAWRDGTWYTARLGASPLDAGDRVTTTVDMASDAVRVGVRTPGDFRSVELTAVDRTAPDAGCVEVRVSASSLNFVDVLAASGRHPMPAEQSTTLGRDFAGVITAVGPDVTDHQVGDRVAGVAAGCWGTFVTCRSELAVGLPDHLSTDVAAAVPTSHVTAWYALHDLARVCAHDKVLIHSATGGLGMAAIAIARECGAQVFATAGSPERRQRLRDMGIQHVYDSRSLSFVDEIRRDTDGYGVDIVLNSSTGPVQRAGLELLAFGGRFIETGVGEPRGDATLTPAMIRQGVSFHAVDVSTLSQRRPDIIRRVLDTVFAKIGDGTLPVPEVSCYPLNEWPAAIELMSTAGHTGKLVLEVPASGTATAVVPPENAPAFRADGAYVITGGLGGLGLFLADTMASAGCGRIVLNARSQPSAEAAEELDRMRNLGTEVELVTGDIADPATAAALVSAATATGLALRGVLHAAAVVEDATLANITDDLLARDWTPKALGAWNLHEATRTESLDWFCCFSSAAALVGSPGQGAYAAANSWLDGFTAWRRAHGLPSNAIAWGPWAQIGKGAGFAEMSESAIAPDEGAHAFETMLRHDRGYAGYTPIAGVSWLADFAKRVPFAESFRPAGDGDSDAGGFLSELSASPRDEWPSRLRRLVSDQISVLLRRSIDPDRPLAEYGIDSLGNLEIRTRIETETGVRISPADITTVRGLADKLCEKLIANADTELTPTA
ncbi:polyketide synthase [Mycobacterium sp. E802]|uniref:sulfolipid-1 biosynthesis phthioceranic/hydroxyphthioceranic acid synthase n=1 Tax=Mycobacterium sp. E802 TaxID=1834152 RepID=UPI0007FBBD4F|nr:type I polyketide synthase [Mycobacterium sp. E802]OBG80159.1 polyketide synthase [Mycobacterium sp. E802]